MDSWLIFYILYEGSVLPLLYGIIRRGGYLERYNSGYYLVLYIIIFSIPLLLWVINGYLRGLVIVIGWSSFSVCLWLLVIIVAFLVKVPIYGLHGWLPKVHVEAPI